jgi:hypothetical protein
MEKKSASRKAGTIQLAKSKLEKDIFADGEINPEAVPDNSRSDSRKNFEIK